MLGRHSTLPDEARAATDRLIADGENDAQRALKVGAPRKRMVKGRRTT
jgi:hypothetical protein